MATDDYSLTLENDYSIASHPSKTFKIDFENGRINGFTDRLDALTQTITTILMTERYRWAIYSWEYGNELVNCAGYDKAYLQSQAKRMITEALSTDDRILSVEDFQFEYNKLGTVLISFKVNTIYGQTTSGVTI